jgi:hypothetical protein
MGARAGRRMLGRRRQRAGTEAAHALPCLRYRVVPNGQASEARGAHKVKHGKVPSPRPLQAMLGPPECRGRAHYSAQISSSLAQSAKSVARLVRSGAS